MQLLSRITLVFAAFALALPVFAGEPLLPPSDADYVFHRIQPLGTDTFTLAGSKQTVLVMATAVSPDMEGWNRVKNGRKTYVLAGDGSRVRTYPQEVQFRITVSARDHLPGVVEPVAVRSDEALNDYLLHLGFRLKIFHELQARTVEPLDVHLMGVPSDVQYDERVYRVTFRLPRVPVSDRMILELLSPEGERITKFHFELM